MSRLPRPILAALRALAVLVAVGFLALVVGNACARQRAYLPETKAGPVFEPDPPGRPPDLAPPQVFFPATKAAPVWNPPAPQAPPPPPQQQQQMVPQQAR